MIDHLDEHRCVDLIPICRKNTWHCLLASEVVHLMCLVPQFFDSIQSNQGNVDVKNNVFNNAYCLSGLANMITVATKNPDAPEMIANITCKVQSRGVRIMLVAFLVIMLVFHVGWCVGYISGYCKLSVASHE